MAPPKKTFTISLPTSDLAAAKRFGVALGFEASACFDVETTLILKCSETFSIFYGAHSVFGKFLPSGRQIASSKDGHEVIVTLTATSKEGVDDLIRKGIEAGGKPGPNMIPEEYAESVYSRSMEDPDGHLYEVVYFDEEAAAGSACAGKKEEN
ncbi:hypothetical protein AJ78_04712 [Emergomyces pasteurianus Ep9510]|uniref:VOC domain-containing protein n=1 Tax=Emergomyces pasteurianus Ep9510 TaxID=1447872 RepID=A0A1J9PG84_9EURO|nr:hypothetical protein AJ78_04712 [Emergomyces pasteurianus Ep9510]